MVGAGLAVICAVLTVGAAPTAALSMPAGPPLAKPVAGAAPAGTQAYLDAMDPVLLAHQQELMAFKGWLITRPGIYEAGFVESADDLATKSTTLLWAGPASPVQRAVVAQARQLGITATVRPVKYNRAQLEAGVHALFASRRDRRWGGFVINGIAATDLSHDGLIVHGSYSRPNIVPAGPAVRSLVDTASAILTGGHRAASSTAAPLDVQVVFDAPVVLATATRYNDTSPFNAGGLMDSNDSLTKCSSGFAVWYGGNSHTTTARHCDQTPYHTVLGNRLYGSSVTTSGQGGARVLTGAGFYWMFDGAYDNSTGYHKDVIGFAGLSVGDGVCTSGGNSGVHCYIKVTNLSFWIDDPYGQVQTIVGAQQQTGGGVIAAATGDSGGPVLVPYTGGTSVGAAGMIQGINDLVGCPGTAFAAPCGRTVYFSSMRTIVNTLSGASLVTGTG